MIKTTFTDFYQFLKNPDDRQIEINFSKKLLITTILFTTIGIITLAVISPLRDLIDDLLDLTLLIDIDTPTSLQLFLSFVIIFPFIEELIFRHFLRYQGIITFILKKQQWQKTFPFLVYLSALTFGFIHLANYTSSSNWIYILSPFVILCQLLCGITITYIRIRLDFLWGVFFHCAWNFLIIFAIPALEAFVEKI